MFDWRFTHALDQEFKRVFPEFANYPRSHIFKVEARAYADFGRMYLMGPIRDRKD